MSFSLCGINILTNGGVLDILEVSLEPDGNISFVGFELMVSSVTSLCIGLNTLRGYGVAPRTDKRLFIFALDYRGSGFLSCVFCARPRAPDEQTYRFRYVRGHRVFFLQIE